MFCQGLLKDFSKFTGKHFCEILFFKENCGPQYAILLKKRLCHGCFPVNFAKFFRRLFFIEQLRWLLLSGIRNSQNIAFE